MVMEFTIDGVAYKARPMDAFTQADVVSILSPIVAAGGAELVPWLKEMRATAAAGGAGSLLDANPAEALKYFGGLTRELAKMSPADRRFVLSACLALVDKQISPTSWAPIWIAAAGQAAEKDLQNNLWLMVRIAFAVIQKTLFPFFTASL
jgi:hypothetical protein